MKISVVGLGKLGLPLAAVLASKGHEVFGIDFNEQFVQKINQKQAPFEEPSLQILLTEHGHRLQATTQYEPAISQTEATFVIVPSPSDEQGFFSNHYILQSIEKIGEALCHKEEYHLVVIISTVMPGSTGGEIKETLERTSHRKIGQELGLCYSPEFIALGSVVRDMLFPDMILIGESDPRAGDFLAKIYETIHEKHPPVQKMNFVNAELTKLAVNTFVTTKISYANMLASLCDALVDSNVEVVTKAIGLDSRIGSKYLAAGPAFGGPCFPRDNLAFTALAKRLNVRADIAEATHLINQDQTERLYSLVKRYTKGKQIGILGLAYKPSTYIVEKSAGIAIANRLACEGYDVSVYDPMASIEAKKYLEPSVSIMHSLQACIFSSETLLITTAWPEFTQEITPELIKGSLLCTTLIDCWRLFSQEAFSQICEVIHLGRANFCETVIEI